MNYQSPGFNLLTSRRPFYLLSLTKMYDNIIYSDIDALWLKDPRPHFKGTDIDFWAQIDGVIEGRPYFEGFIPHICTGFLALKSTPKTMKMLEQWHTITSIDKSQFQEQNMLQKVAFELSLNFAVLPVRYFPFGIAYFGPMSEHEHCEVVIVHNNFIIGKKKKIQRFKDFQLWALDYQKKHGSKCKKENSKFVLQTRTFQCSLVDVLPTQRVMPVTPGNILLTEITLLKAFQQDYNNFKTNIGEYFYDASLHWKTVFDF